MRQDSIGVAVIGGGMAGRAHAAGYRMASTLFGTDRPDVRLVAIADTNEAIADDTAKRYGYERAEYSWQAIAAADDIQVVSVVVANHLHREIVEGLLAAGKNVLCEKPLAGSIADAQSMVSAAASATGIASVGYTYRRSPAVQAIADELEAGRLGDIVHFDGRYRADYSLDPTGPITWRYKGGLGTGALADVGSHLIDLAEYVAGPITSVRGAQFSTVITERPVPVGVTYGHTKADTTGEMAAVENEDVATFTVQFEGGFVGTFSASRVSHCNPDGLSFDVFGTKGSASWALERASEFHISTTDIDDTVNGRRQVIIGPQHPYIRGGLPMDAGGVGHGKAEFFAYQARAFLDQVAGIQGLPELPDFAHGLRGMQIVAAITESAAGNGIAVKI
ncbi:Gfo/Idh/MocA family oxidoreductase [Rhodococcus sp. BP-252]|uniref:Dehydrogenase n=1 Tax=Rhodococcoides kyotonense TaxID=398843 RepID=A0A177Y724_9NOCA|nr:MULTISPECIES: Gfo/Idh/MocA family oxidoreductase [Rhodococcus]MBY6410317.1 Gfo/Idh/MocA family oxidoreductase [Rhodococcus sp. BP-320]MBY6416199.1 Gfo/Idh/MocA family oxidoreductase [Rhodococcus sp. BP-321]MBY6420194.1 Gfo/Idh/MocA family oxidoreductase [Rhodococcus sp. BP-324]MBY6424873.1 Gfo/Idh/MocA family oxidoreductase [Rhodococcus sp. BP-323]MBY6430421.1 Gfo/Idh/MocA family oxidoreductase [Rhodococcus sp. BP-322]